MEAGVDFIACDFPQANRLTVHILAAVAEHEALMISARTKAALSAARARGVELRGLRGNRERMALLATEANSISAKRRAESATKRNADLIPVISNIQEAGHKSHKRIAEELNRRGITAARGGQWSANQLRRVIRRTARP
ncbi:DNA invertase Pin-like site-specific DNA recombinase [Granulicella aggregans]|uniref:DNA invertase Pin-like site-specific DNA recombinase n=2 Tax=Granulicella aggregans TaxID=474949 RepID=A0A7W7ZDP6_9BACT|nr:DNA invertase Pin-like site-specific DNA recombinase [Granulicella aggregans]